MLARLSAPACTITALPSPSNTWSMVRWLVVNVSAPVPSAVTNNGGKSPEWPPWVCPVAARCPPADVKSGPSHLPTLCRWMPWKPGVRLLAATVTRMWSPSVWSRTKPESVPAAFCNRATPAGGTVAAAAGPAEAAGRLKALSMASAISGRTVLRMDAPPRVRLGRTLTHRADKSREDVADAAVKDRVGQVVVGGG